MTIDELNRISTAAMLAAVAAHERAMGGTVASDFGRAARAWERLADAADNLHALLLREARWKLEPPTS